MVTLQFYENDGDARIFDKKEYLFDMKDGKEVLLTKIRIDEILKKIGLKGAGWKSTDWGWQCKLINNE